ncbi:helix-turn-helix domain-containing protein [Bdellovibrio bacteriovorus]|uniref:helix-turn-helix domain-containing protein n=1 Tax=Bdellovibrio bacteriovorus TaxID=959 RepID=UPI003A80AA8E
MEQNMAKSIGRAKLVKKARIERAWPQRQLADAAKVNLRTIQRLERDGTASFETLMAVAGAFDIDVKELTPTSKERKKSKPSKKVHLLPRLTSGMDLAAIIRGADLFQVERDEADDKRAQDAMISILELLKGDIVRWHDADLTGKLKIEFELSQEIKGLEQHGFYLFGVNRNIPRAGGKPKERLSMCTIYMSHSQSPKIVRDKSSNMVIPALLTEVAS